MDRLRLDLDRISEMRWQEEQDFWSGDHRVNSTKSNNGQAVVGLILSRKFGQRVEYYEQYSERIIVAKINTKPTCTTVVQVYMPTSQADDEDVEKVYEEIDEILRYIKGDENVIVMGDWNAVVGKGEKGR